mgnify:CR=1 FL=1|tara:strand:+ start:5865 stop:6590 length:726 start_codon:yes stop_codon:yes gene_type:complete
MAVNTNLQNWARWDFDQRSNYIIETGNPTVGFGGGSVFQQVTEQNSQTSVWSMTEDGQMNIFNDDCITIVGGVTKDGGTCLNLIGKNGDVTITAERNGDIKIKGSNILIDADENINIMSKKNVTIQGKNSIFFDTPNLATNALTGNLAPRDVTFGGLVFRGTKVGGNAISDAFTGGTLDNLQDIAKGKAQEAAKQLKTLSGSIDTGALASQASELGGQLQNQLSSIDTSGLSNALSNFGGF